jgi:hypothetical protein
MGLVLVRIELQPQMVARTFGLKLIDPMTVVSCEV